MCADRHAETLFKVLKSATVVVPAAVGVPRATFQQDDTNTLGRFSQGDNFNGNAAQAG